MIVAMGAMLGAAVSAHGGAAATWRALDTIPDFTNGFLRDLPLPGIAGAMLFAASWLFAELSVIGQSHIMVRFMALDRPQNIARTLLVLRLVHGVLRHGNSRRTGRTHQRSRFVPH